MNPHHLPPRPRSARSAFTLIEMLIVVTIMAMLSGMLSVVVTLAQKQGKATATKALLMKVDQGVRQFRIDMRVYPWQTDLGTPPAEPTTWGNNLGLRLGWKPADSAERLEYATAFQSDLAIIRDKFRFVSGENVPPSGLANEGTHAFRLEPASGFSRSNLLPYAMTKAQAIGNISDVPRVGTMGYQANAQALTRMAQEITTLRYLAGQLPTLAPVGVDPLDPADLAKHPNEDPRYPSFNYRYFPYNKPGHFGDDSRGPVLTSATAATDGWRGEYLADTLRQRNLGGGLDATGISVLDAWGRPLIYVCQVSPGSVGYTHNLARNGKPVREARYNMNPQGRDLTWSMDSDIRTTAAQPHVLEFELWSAGPDGLFSAQRDDPVNRDNVAILGYHRGLD